MNISSFRKFRIWIAIIFSACSLIIFHNLWIPRGIELTFDYKLDRAIQFDIFYGQEGEKISKYRTLKERVYEKEGRFNVVLPTKVLNWLRIDFGQHPGNIQISDVHLSGQKTTALESTSKNLKIYNAKTISREQNILKLTSSHNDPFIEYKDLTIGAGRTRAFNLLHFTLIAFCPGYIWWILCDMWTDKKSSRKKIIPALQNIEFLRLLLTLGVLLFHFRMPFGLWSGGDYCVEFFFLISGYLLAYTFRSETRILDFAKKRWLRFAPLVVVGALLNYRGIESFYGMFLLQYTGLCNATPPWDPAWYIGVLFWCSLFYIALMKTLSTQARNTVIGILAMVSCIIIVQSISRPWDLIGGIIHFRLLRGIACMGIGILLAQVCIRAHKQTPTSYFSTSFYTILEGALLLYLSVSFFSPVYFNEHWAINVIIQVALLALFVAKRGKISQILESPIYGTMGKYCLSIYLTHQVFFSTAPYYSKDISTPALEITTLIILSVILGVLCYYFVEKPAAKYLKIMFDKLK